MRHGGQILVEQLKIQGVTRVFSVPGESFLAALDGLYASGIENVVCRHEGGAAMMAEATGKLTGAPGIAFVTRGPGASNAAAGVHVAKQDSTPMILFVGQIERGHRDREAFQELDYRATFGPIAKWAAEIDQIERLPEYISRAFHVACAGRPGPVVLALPEDMLSAHADVADLPRRAQPPQAASAAQVEAVTEALAQAKRPLLVVGGSLWSPEAAKDLETFAENWNLPVAASFRRQSLIDNRHSHYAGDLGVGMNPALGRRLSDCDLLLALGARISDSMTRSYELISPAAPAKTIIHIHPDPDELGRVYRPDLAIAVSAREMVAALAQTRPPAPRPSDWRRAARADYEAWQSPKPTPGEVKLEEIIRWLSDNLPEDAIVTNGAGNYAAFLHRYFRYKSYPSQQAPTSGSMGYGFPAAIAASLAHPDRTILCMAGDGCFQMTLNEMSTALQHGAKPIVVVANNGQYGTIRMHQERHFPARPSGTALMNPDFAALAQAYGGHGERVTRSEDFAAAFHRARAAETLAVIELTLDPEALTTSATLSQIREEALAARKRG